MALCIGVLLGIGFIIWGLISLFSKDTAWSFTERSNRMKGVASERSDDWERVSNINGVILIVVGIILVIASMSVLGS
jgi:hypothetical protein